MSSIESVQVMLKKREAWKYADIKIYLDSNNISHEFEYAFNEYYVYDLVLFDYRILVEFDGSGHNSRNMMCRDFEKDNAAEENGYDIVRIKVDDNLVIPAEQIAGMLSSYRIL